MEMLRKGEYHTAEAPAPQNRRRCVVTVFVTIKERTVAMRRQFWFILCLSVVLLTCRQGRAAGQWELPVKYDMSYGNLKAYRYGPMLGGIGTGGFSFNTAGFVYF